MSMAERIMRLRKAKGISQEELAEVAGVSRQAVSKWESEQSVPDVDRIVLLSEYFGVSTDYLLKGTEAPEAAGRMEKERANPMVFVIVATVLIFIGLIVACAVWYEQQHAMAIGIGLVIMALGCMVFGVGMLSAKPVLKKRAKRVFWSANIWLLSVMPLSVAYNLLFSRMIAPYPLMSQPLGALAGYGVAYLAVCLGVVWALARRK